LLLTAEYLNLDKNSKPSVVEFYKNLAILDGFSKSEEYLEFSRIVELVDKASSVEELERFKQVLPNISEIYKEIELIEYKLKLLQESPYVQEISCYLEIVSKSLTPFEKIDVYSINKKIEVEKQFLSKKNKDQLKSKNSDILENDEDLLK
jgi:hypothetical protein